MATSGGMSRVINAVMAGVLIGIMAVVFLTSYSSIIFAGDLARFLPNGIGIALASATIMATVVALVSSHRGMIAVPQDINSVVFGDGTRSQTRLPPRKELSWRSSWAACTATAYSADLATATLGIAKTS